MEKRCRECDVNMTIHGKLKTFSEVSPICWKCWSESKKKTSTSILTSANNLVTTALSTTVLTGSKYKKGEKVFVVQHDGVFQCVIDSVEQYSGYQLYTVFIDDKRVDYVLEEDIFYIKSSASHEFNMREKKGKTYSL